VGVKPFRYAADGWGVGELWLDGDRAVWHEPPRAGPGPGRAAAHPLVARLQAYFAGEPVTFDDVELDLSELSPFHRELAAALRRVPRGEVVSYGELAALAGRPGAPRAADATAVSREAGTLRTPRSRVTNCTSGFRASRFRLARMEVR